MARVVIEPHMFGEEWFSPVKEELVKCSNVRFAYCGIDKERNEISKVRDAARFFKLMGDLKRRDDAHLPTASRHFEEVTQHAVWKSNGCCDDGHLFALVKALPTPYVFSKDHRLAACRDCLAGNLDSSFTRFSVISTQATYQANRNNIMA